MGRLRIRLPVAAKDCVTQRGSERRDAGLADPARRLRAADDVNTRVGRLGIRSEPAIHRHVDAWHRDRAVLADGGFDHDRSFQAHETELTHTPLWMFWD